MVAENSCQFANAARCEEGPTVAFYTLLTAGRAGARPPGHFDRGYRLQRMRSTQKVPEHVVVVR